MADLEVNSWSRRKTRIGGAPIVVKVGVCSMTVIRQTPKVQSATASVQLTPAAPVSVTATLVGDSGITVSWTDPGDDIALANYRVYRSTDAVTYALQGTTAAVADGATASYSQSGLSPATYRYRVTCYSTDGLESATTTSNAVTVATQDVLEWTISDVPTALPVAGVAGVAGYYDLRTNYVNVPAGVTPAFTITNKSATGGSSTSTISIDGTTGVLSWTDNTPVDAYSVTVDLSESAEADWIRRSTADGVVWAHDFRNDAEYYNFLRGQNALTATLGSTPFGSSRAIRGMSRGAMLTENVLGAAARYESQIWKVDDPSVFPDPAVVGSYSLYPCRASDETAYVIWEEVQITAIDYSAKQMTVTRGVSGAGSTYWQRQYTAGVSTIGKGHTGQWRKPFGAFPAGQNGLALPDRGIVTGIVPQRDWTGYGEGKSWLFRQGYYGHAEYVAANPTLFDGDEFYLQFRAKVNINRFLTDSKLWFLQIVEGSPDHQLFGHMRDYGAYAAARWVPPAGWTHATGGSHATVQAAWGTGTVGAGNSYQPGSPYAATCLYEPTTGNPSECWMYPPDTWVTYMIHMKPGRDQVAETLFELYAAVDGETSYTRLISVSNRTVSYSGVYNGYNSFWPQNYANDYAGSGSTFIPPGEAGTEYTQIILSKQYIEPPQVFAP